MNLTATLSKSISITFAVPKPENMYKTGYAFTYLLTKESVANDVIGVSLNHAIDEWRRRLSACLDAEGGHFEHYFRLLLSK